MIDQDMLRILVCPRDHTPLKLADRRLLDRINQAISAGQIENLGGDPVKDLLQSGLVRQDETLLYPIVDDIPVLLIDEAIALDQLE